MMFIGYSDLIASLERATPEECLSPSIRAICRTLDAWEAAGHDDDEPADDGDTGAWAS